MAGLCPAVSARPLKNWVLCRRPEGGPRWNWETESSQAHLQSVPDLLEEDLIETSRQTAIAKTYVYSICGSLIGQMKKLQVKPFSS